MGLHARHCRGHETVETGGAGIDGVDEFDTECGLTGGNHFVLCASGFSWWMGYDNDGFERIYS